MKPISEQSTANKLKELCEKAGISYPVRMQIQGIIDERAQSSFLQGVKHCHEQYKKR